MATSYAAFLRGINVGSRRVSGPDLAAAVGAVEGIAEPRTFLASGNVVFTDERRRKPAAVESLIEAAIEAAFGWSSKAFLRTGAVLGELAAAEPFTRAQLEASKGKQQVVLLEREPTQAAARKILALSTDADRLALQGANLHWLPRGGFAESELDLGSIGELTGQGTTRTMNTIARIHARYFS